MVRRRDIQQYLHRRGQPRHRGTDQGHRGPGTRSHAVFHAPEHRRRWQRFTLDPSGHRPSPRPRASRADVPHRAHDRVQRDAVLDRAFTETGFNIYSSSGGLVGTAAASPGTGSVVQWTETGLTPGAQYQRYAVAVANGESAPSNSASRYTLANPPYGLTTSTATGSSISLLWNANNNASGTRFLVERATAVAGPFGLVANITVANLNDAG